MTAQAVIYARVSSREQEETGYSLPAQQKFLEDYATRKTFEIVRVFSVAESASGVKQRNTFEEMMAFVKRRGIRILICEKTDRLTRSRRDAVVIDEWVKENAEREVHFAKENFILSRDSRANEKFIWGIKVEVAQYYTNNLSEEVRKGQREKIAQGWLPTKPPLGYRTVGEKGHKIHDIDETVAPLVRKMFELYATGTYPLSRLHKTMRKEGLRTRGGYALARSRIADLIHDPFYIGQIRWNGRVYSGKQAPLVSRDVFLRCQEIMHGRGAARYRTHLHLFKGLIRCKDCGGIVTWEQQKGTTYGHCSSYRKCVRRVWYKEADFEELVAAELRRFQLIQPRLAEWVRKALRQVHAGEIAYRDAALKELHNRQVRLRQQLDVLYSDRLEGRISANLHDAKRAEIESQLQNVIESIQRHADADKRYFELGINLFELSQQAPGIFKRTTPERKRRLLALIFEEMYTSQGKLFVRFTDVFYTLAQLAMVLSRSKIPKTMPPPHRIFELPKSPYFDLQNGTQVPQNRALLAWWSFFRTSNLLSIIPKPDLFRSEVAELLALPAPLNRDVLQT